MRIRVALFTIVCLAAIASPAWAQTGAAPPTESGSPPAVTSRAAILADGKTGKVLFGKDVHTPAAPASLTKIITALVAKQEYKLDEVVTVSDAINTVRGERLGLAAGQQISVRELLYAMLLMSGNDAATALAAHHPGGYDAFIAKMNALARRLGAAESHFVNPHGLDADGHQSSAWDLALFTRKLLADPFLATVVATPTHPIAWADGSIKNVRNHNKLMFRRPEQTIGVKTGFTNRAGKCLAAASRTQAGTAITIVLHAVDHYGDTTALWGWFETRPDVAALGTLALPKDQTNAAPPRVHRPASVPGLQSKAGWMVLPMSVLAGVMLLTLGWPRRRTPISEASQHHPWLDPVLADD